MSANVYKYRNPNDHATYTDRKKLIEYKRLQLQAAKNRAIQADTEMVLSIYRGQQFKHENYAVLSDGTIMDISKYCKPQYMSYDGNNPALVQGAAMSISPKAIFSREIDKVVHVPQWKIDQNSNQPWSINSAINSIR